MDKGPAPEHYRWRIRIKDPGRAGTGIFMGTRGRLKTFTQKLFPRADKDFYPAGGNHHGRGKYTKGVYLLNRHFKHYRPAGKFFFTITRVKRSLLTFKRYGPGDGSNGQNYASIF